MTNKPEQLTADELDSLESRLTSGAGFYFENGRRPGAIMMAELLTKAAKAVTELQERRKPVITFYSEGIAAAANWVDQQRESYDNEHGRRDNDTGSFEFGNDAHRDYSDTLAEIAEGIRALHPNAGMPPAPVVPDEKPMPEASKMHAIDAVAAIAEVKGWNACRTAMLKAAPKQENI